MLEASGERGLGSRAGVEASSSACRLDDLWGFSRGSGFRAQGVGLRAEVAGFTFGLRSLGLYKDLGLGGLGLKVSCLGHMSMCPRMAAETSSGQQFFCASGLGFRGVGSRGLGFYELKARVLPEYTASTPYHP